MHVCDYYDFVLLHDCDIVLLKYICDVYFLKVIYKSTWRLMFFVVK